MYVATSLRLKHMNHEYGGSFCPKVNSEENMRKHANGKPVPLLMVSTREHDDFGR